MPQPSSSASQDEANLRRRATSAAAVPISSASFMRYRPSGLVRSGPLPQHMSSELLYDAGPRLDDRGTSAWFDEIAREVEDQGDQAFTRARPRLFETARRPHLFSSEERRRMDRYESIDYSEPQSTVYKVSMAARGGERRWLKWFVFIVIGVVVGLWSVLLFQTLDFLSDAKLRVVQRFIQSAAPTATTSVPSMSSGDDGGTVGGGSAYKTGDGLPLWAVLRGYYIFVAWSVLAALLSSLCCLVMPSAAGSGIPDVMAYLNGIMFPRIFNIRNLVVKTLSCVLAVSAGLPVGTEGPMIHIGSLIGAGLPTGRSRSLQCSATSLLTTFRNAKDQRDFISAGAACGLTCAFSSPLGGMLFVLEEMASFFPVQLAWLVLVSCFAATCVTQLANTYLSGWRLAGCAPAMSSGNFRDAAIAMFYIEAVPGNVVEMNARTFGPTLLGAVGAGLLAVLYTVSSTWLSRWRARTLFPQKTLRVLEPCVFAYFYSSVCYTLPLFFPCTEVPAYVRANAEGLHVELFSAFCTRPETHFSPLATLMMTSPYNLLRLLFSRRTADLMPWGALLSHLALYTTASSYAGGMFISCGTVIPSLLIGSVFGRLVGLCFPRALWADPGVLALIGAAAYFAGISRLSFSLIVIMMELTADLTHVTCLMVAVVVAKSVADQFCHAFYHASLEVKAVPFLETQSSMHDLDTFCVRDIMSAPVTTLQRMQTVGHLGEVLRTTTHNAYPVTSMTDHLYEGMMPRAQLQLLLWVIYLRETGDHGMHGDDMLAPPDGTSPRLDAARHDVWLSTLPHATEVELRRVKEYLFWHRLPAVPSIERLSLNTIHAFVDLTPYADLGAYYVQEVMCISRAYYMFRHLGLRHLPVLQRDHRVVGIITRTNFVGDRLREKLSAAEQQQHSPQTAR